MMMKFNNSLAVNTYGGRNGNANGVVGSNTITSKSRNNMNNGTIASIHNNN